MRWLSFVHDGTAGFGFIDASGEAVVDVAAVSAYADLKSAIADDALGRLAQAHASATPIALADIEYAPTITNPDKILCVGLNYKAHQEETGRGGEGVPTIFVRFAAAQMGHLAPMIRPRESATLDFEGEIALIIGKGGRRMRAVHYQSWIFSA